MKNKLELLTTMISEGLFDPRRAAARQLFNEAVNVAWAHAVKHGDVGGLQRIVDAHQDRGARARLVRKLMYHLPLVPSPKNSSRLSLDRDALHGWSSPESWPDFSIADPLTRSVHQSMEIGGIEFLPDELMSLLIDHMALNRNEFDIAEINDLISMLESIRNRKLKRTTQTAVKLVPASDHVAGENE